MVKFLIHRPVAVTMVFIALMVVGITSLRLIPVSLMPGIDIPEITVRFASEGASSRDVEDQFTKQVRRKLLQVNHLRDIASTSYNGKAVLKLYFEYGTDIQYAYLDVNEKIDELMSSMPRDFDRPQVIKASITDIPAFFVNVKMKKDFTADEERFAELSLFTENVIKKRIEQLPEVAFADISGTDYPEIFIEIKKEEAAFYGIGINEIEKAIQDNNISGNNMSLRDGQYIFNVRYSSVLVDRSDIEDILIRKGNRVFRMKDVAKIGVRSANRSGMFKSGGIRGITLAVIKKSDVQMAKLKSSFAELKKELEKDYPRLNFEVTRDQTLLLQYSIGNLKNTLFMGSLLAIVVMLLFLSDYRSPLLIAISIPVSLVITLFLFYLAGISINIISLSGLVLGVGMMIDNSIIVIDNIHQHKQTKNIDLACIVGTNEIFRPLLSSVLTTCAVFLPLLFLSGITGALFYDQAVAVSIGLMVSLIVSITLLPVYYRILYRSKKEGKVSRFFKRIGIYSGLESSYDRTFDFVYNHRRTVLIFFAWLLAGGLYLGTVLTKESFPPFSKDDAILHISWNSNISIEESEKRSDSFFAAFEDKISVYNANLGSTNFFLSHTSELESDESEIYFSVNESENLDSVSSEMERWFWKKYPDAVVEVSSPPNLFEQIFKEEKTPLIVNFWNSKQKGVVDPETFVKISSAIADATGITPENRETFQNYLNIIPDYEALIRYDVDVNTLNNTLKKAIDGHKVSTLRNGNFLVPVVLLDSYKSIDQIMDETLVKSTKGVEIPVSSLIKVTTERDYKKINGGKDGTYNNIFLFPESGKEKDAIAQIQEVISAYPNMECSFSGAHFRNKQLFRELMLILGLAILLLYFILAAQFESVLQPIIVLVEIPIDIAGVLMVIWATGHSLNLMSLIGIVVMTGVIINDSILKIDTINHLRKEGYDLMAAIHNGGRRRLKPIVMTSLTTILALVPFLFGSDMGSVLQRPLAVAVIGGMTIGTLVSLYLIPLLYWYMHKKGN